MKTKLALLFFATASLFCGHARAGFAFNYDYDVNIYQPVASEWTEDTYGGIWYTNLAAHGIDSPILGHGLIMCTGDFRDVIVNTWAGPYAALDFLSATNLAIAADPGNYTFPTSGGFTLASRTPDVKAQTAKLIDQMSGTLVLPSDLQGHEADDWIECKADALVAAVHNVWSDVTYVPTSEKGEEWEIDQKNAYYGAYMASIEGVTAANYTTSGSVWLVGQSTQVLFFTPIPEPSSNVGLLALVTFGLFFRQRRA